MEEALQVANTLNNAFTGGKPAAGSPEAEAKAAADKAKIYKGSTAQQTTEQGLKHITSDTAKSMGISTSLPINMQQLRDDPGYMSHVQGVANLPLDIPAGWDYKQATFGEDGRLLTSARLEPLGIENTDGTTSVDPNAADLSSNDVRDWLTVANKKQEAQDSILRVQQMQMDMAPEAAKQAGLAGREEAERIGKYGEAKTARDAESAEAKLVRDWSGAESKLDRTSQEAMVAAQTTSAETIAGRRAFTDLRIANNQNKTAKQLQDDQQKWQKEVQHVMEVSEAALDRTLQETIQGTATQRQVDAIARDDNTHTNTMLAIAEHGAQERLNITDRAQEERIGMGVAGLEERKNIVERSKAELAAIEAKGEIETKMQEARETGLMDRLEDQITSDELLAGNQITSDEAIALAERLMRKTLQDAQIEAATETLTEEGKQAIANIKEAGTEERLTLADQETLQKALLATQGEQRIAEIAKTGTVGTEQQLAQFQQMQAAGRITTEQDIEQTRATATAFTSGLNNALSTATQSGDYSAVNQALATALPELPTGVRWDRDQGFLMREGFQGREMDAATRQLTAALTPAFKARDRAEEATRQANTIQLELTAQRQNAVQASELFRQHMMTGDIDSAEEAAARQKMAETAAIAANTKMEHLNTLFGLIQNPVLLGMAKRHGLLGQIQTVLGFEISHVPEGPTAGFGAVPNTNEWQTMDTDEQSFSLAAFVEQGGSPDAFMRAIAGAAPAQLQQVTYGVL